MCLLYTLGGSTYELDIIMYNRIEKKKNNKNTKKSFKDRMKYDVTIDHRRYVCTIYIIHIIIYDVYKRVYYYLESLDLPCLYYMYVYIIINVSYNIYIF